MLLKISGIKENSLLDVLFNISFVIWFTGCNFRCPFCFNRDVVLGKGIEVPLEEILDKIKDNKNFIDYVQATGGEPTLQEDALTALFKEVKKLNLKTSLNTNGSNPDVIKRLIEKGLVDHVAMDVKAPLEEEFYRIVTDTKIENIVNRIKESLKVIKDNVNFIEIRTTVIPNFVDFNEVCDIAKFLKEFFKKKKFYYVLQQFLPAESVIDKKFRDYPTYTHEDLKNMAKYIKENIGLENVVVRSLNGVELI